MKKNSEKIPMLSKTRYQAGLQCPLRLWYTCYNRELATEISRVQQAIFHMGHKVGALATELYSGGIRIEEDHLHHQEAVWSTLVAMEDPKVKAIYEAGFLYDDVRVRVDVLQRLENGKWNLIEVKSSTRVKEEYYPDVGIQYYVLKGAGLNIHRVFLVHLNNQYVYDGKALDLEGLFSSSDLTEGAIAYQEEIPELLAGLKEMLAASDPPEIAPSKHCNRPYGCEFWEYCMKGMPDHWVIQLSGIGQNKLDELEGMGIYDIGEIPDEFSLTALQERIRNCVVNDEAYIAGSSRTNWKMWSPLFTFLISKHWPSPFHATPEHGPIRVFPSNGQITFCTKTEKSSTVNIFVRKTGTRERNLRSHFWMFWEARGP